MTKPSPPQGRVPTDPSLIDATEVAHEQGVDPEVGLSSKEAALRLQRHGPNLLRQAPPEPVWRKVLSHFRDPLTYLLLAAVVVALAAWVTGGAEGWPIDASVIAAIVLLNAILGFVQQMRAENAVAALQSMTAANATVLRDGERATVPASELVPGDVLVLSEGDAVGADARLFEVASLQVSEASLTGESHAVLKDPRPLAEAVAPGDRLNMVFKGTAVTQGVGRGVVTGTGMDTEMGAIAEMLASTRQDATPLQKEISHVGRWLGIAVVAIAIGVMATVFLVSDVRTATGAVDVLLLGVSLAVAAVPEGLPAILSVVLAIGVQRLARRNALVKDLSSVETLGSASVICSDKTGTLTRNEMTIQRIVTASGRVELTGVGYRPEGVALQNGQALTDTAVLTEAHLVLAGGSLANDAQLSEHDGEWRIQGDPTEAAFLVAARKLDGVIDRMRPFSRQGQVPFTSDRKLMSSLEKHEDGRLFLVTKGAPDVLLSRCTALRVVDEVVPLDDAGRARATQAIEALSGEAFRTLGVAYRPLADGHSSGIDESLENELVYLGVVGIIDPPRAEAAASVSEARRAGVRVIMITGDHPVTAARIAADLGIVEPEDRALSGADLDALDEPGLRQATRTTSVFARVTPRHKLRIVDALQADGNVVAMTGDGVNDAPALKSADIGVAMGIAGTEVTKEAGHMILGDDNFATIVAAVRQGRVIFDNIKKFLRYLLSSNMGEVFTVFLGVVFARFLGLDDAGSGAVVAPLLATQILWINLVTDSGPALAMGVDPETDDVMGRRPRRSSERVIDGRMWGGIISIGLVMAAASLFTLDLYLPGGLLEGNDSLTVARTAAFTTLVLAQLFNCFNSRSETTSAFHHPFVNKWLWGAVTLALALQVAVVELPWLQTAFGTASLDLEHWSVCVLAASSVLWFDELRKVVLRRAHPPAP